MEQSMFPAPKPERRILRLRYRSAHGRRRVYDHLIKVPYGAAFGLAEVMARALVTGEVIWFRLTAPESITPEQRAGLVRWQEALDTDESGVRWAA